MSLQLSNITFNNVDTIGVGSPVTNIMKSNRPFDSVSSLIDKANNGQITSSKLVQSIGALDAISINWNGAIVSGQELNTTGEVLSSYKIAI